MRLKRPDCLTAKRKQARFGAKKRRAEGHGGSQEQEHCCEMVAFFLRRIATQHSVWHHEDFPFQLDDQRSFEIIAHYTKGIPRDALKIAADIMRNLWRDGRKKTTPEEVEQVSIENMLPLEQLSNKK